MTEAGIREVSVDTERSRFEEVDTTKNGFREIRSTFPIDIHHIRNLRPE
jgi:hypothetical protein